MEIARRYGTLRHVTTTTNIRFTTVSVEAIDRWELKVLVGLIGSMVNW